MKKWTAWLLVIALLAALSGCSSQEPVQADPTPEVKATEAPKATQAPAADDEGKKDADQVPNDNPIQSNGTILNTNLWTLDYDETQWVYEEDDFYDDEEYSKIILEIPDGDDGYEANVEIRVSVEDAEGFRDYLYNYEFDPYEYAVNDAYEKVTVGGVECLMQKGTYWGDPCLRYLARDVGAGATVFVEILGDYANDTRIAELIAGLQFNLTDVGNVDFPWPWEGAPFAAEHGTATVGTHTLETVFLPMSEPLITRETFDHSVAVYGDTVYLLEGAVIGVYTMGDEGLTLTQRWGLPAEYDAMYAAPDGTLYLSAFMEPFIAVKDGVQTASYEGPDTVAMHPGGEWGISWFSGPECNKVTLSGGTIAMEPMTFEDVNTIMHLNVGENYIFVCGTDADSNHRVFIYDFSGNPVLTLSDAEGDSLGSITFMAETDNGFIGLDGNMREVILWTKDGTYIGEADDGDLYGTNYPWFCSGVKMDDGSSLVIMTDDRADQSAMELVAFRLSGF